MKTSSSVQEVMPHDDIKPSAFAANKVSESNTRERRVSLEGNSYLSVPLRTYVAFFLGENVCTKADTFSSFAAFRLVTVTVRM